MLDPVPAEGVGGKRRTARRAACGHEKGEEPLRGGRACVRLRYIPYEPYYSDAA